MKPGARRKKKKKKQQRVGKGLAGGCMFDIPMIWREPGMYVNIIFIFFVPEFPRAPRGLK